MQKDQKGKIQINFTPIISKKNLKTNMRKRNNKMNSTSTKTNMQRDVPPSISNSNYSQEMKNYYQLGHETFRQKKNILSNIEMKTKQNSLLNETINLKKDLFLKEKNLQMRINESNKLKCIAFSQLNHIGKTKNTNSNNMTIIKNPSQNPKNKMTPLNLSEKRKAQEETNFKDYKDVNLNLNLKLKNRTLCPKSAKIKRIKVNIIDDNCFVKTNKEEKEEKEENIDLNLKIASQIEKIHKIFEELSGNVKTMDININQLKLVVNPIIEDQKGDLKNSISVLSFNIDENSDLTEENILSENIDELVD